ncbi:arsenate reductase [Fodinibius roseus]|uniref:Arsenate reductase n=1 Tax=Fodinibius roseus TaxID=1194090 RepID=A0A1M4ZEJ6_9BACT|nr:protein-tyrosine-phosphatase [Fodinibius roseus]SHF16473.1 arsenate reductase [Fodinibius roseus]
MYPNLKSYIRNSKVNAPGISQARKGKLAQLAGYIRAKKGSGDPARLTFICTHNSRRSHLCQIWSAVMAEYLGLDHIQTYSGGTEATAFNPRAVAAVERAGFKVEDPGGENPRYNVFFDENKEPLVCFSKRFDDSHNPRRNFAAVMTCTDADENCPVVPGAEKRFSIPYVDPKESDGTPGEMETYDKRCRQIAMEMFYLMSQV